MNKESVKAVLKDSSAGCVAGLSGVIVGFPFETLKVLQNSLIKKIRFNFTLFFFCEGSNATWALTISICCSKESCVRERSFLSPLVCVKKKIIFDCAENLSQKKIRDGVLSPLSSSPFFSAFNFGAYGYSSRYLAHALKVERETLPTVYHAVAGSMAAVPWTVLTCPFEQVKVLMQSCSSCKERVYKSTFHCVREVYRMKGIHGLYCRLPTNFIAGIISK